MEPMEKVFNKLDEMSSQIGDVKISIAGVSGRLDGMDIKLMHTVTRSEMAADLKREIKEHQMNCRDDITGVISNALTPTKRDNRDSVPPRKDSSNTIRISLTGMNPLVKYLIYLLAAAILGAGGAKVGAEIEKASENTTDSKTEKAEK